MSTLSNLLSIKQAQQNLQTGAIQQQTAQADSQQAQQKNSELAAVGNLTKNAYSSGIYKKEDGSFDNQKFANDVAQVAPTYGQGIANDATVRAGEIYQNQKTLFGLNGDRRKQIGDAFGALSAQVDQSGQPTVNHNQVIDTIEQLREQNPDDKAYSRMLTSMAASIPPQASGAQLQQQLRNMAVMTNSSTADQTNQTPATMQGPHGLQVVNTNPQAVGGVGQRGAPLPQGLTPQIVTSPTTGGQGVIGGQQGLTPAPIGGQGGGANSWQPPAGLQQIQGDVEAARKIGDAVPTNRSINDRIMKLADRATTGPGSNFVHQAAAAAGLPSGSSYQELGAFLDRQAAMAQQAMGLPNTNAGLEAAKAFTGNTEYSNQVVKDKTRFVDALNTAAGVYRAGLDKVVGTGPVQNTGAYNAFRGAWAKNYDPDVFAYENAVKRGDTQAQQEIEKDQGRKGMAELLQKRRALMGLVNGQ